jgi:hypothetical protein
MIVEATARAIKAAITVMAMTANNAHLILPATLRKST